MAMYSGARERGRNSASAAIGRTLGVETRSAGSVSCCGRAGAGAEICGAEMRAEGGGTTGARDDVSDGGITDRGASAAGAALGRVSGGSDPDAAPGGGGTGGADMRGAAGSGAAP